MIERIKDEAYFAMEWVKDGVYYTTERAKEIPEEQPVAVIAGTMVGMAGGYALINARMAPSYETEDKVESLKIENAALTQAQTVLNESNMPKAANDQAQYALDTRIIENNQQITTIKAEKPQEGASEIIGVAGFELGLALIGALTFAAASRRLRGTVVPKVLQAHASYLTRNVESEDLRK